MRYIWVWDGGPKLTTGRWLAAAANETGGRAVWLGFDRQWAAPPNRWRLQRGEQFFLLPFDQVADLPVLLGGHVLRVGDVPVLLPPGADERARVPAPHGDGDGDVRAVEPVERLRRVGGQVVPPLAHELDRPRVHPPGRTAA